jgi:hypothetical protein
MGRSGMSNSSYIVVAVSTDDASVIALSADHTVQETPSGPSVKNSDEY